MMNPPSIQNRRLLTWLGSFLVVETSCRWLIHVLIQRTNDLQPLKPKPISSIPTMVYSQTFIPVLLAWICYTYTVLKRQQQQHYSFLMMQRMIQFYILIALLQWIITQSKSPDRDFTKQYGLGMFHLGIMRFSLLSVMTVSTLAWRYRRKRQTPRHLQQREQRKAVDSQQEQELHQADRDDVMLRRSLVSYGDRNGKPSRFQVLLSTVVCTLAYLSYIASNQWSYPGSSVWKAAAYSFMPSLEVFLLDIFIWICLGIKWQCLQHVLSMPPSSKSSTQVHTQQQQNSLPSIITTPSQTITARNTQSSTRDLRRLLILQALVTIGTLQFLLNLIMGQSVPSEETSNSTTDSLSSTSTIHTSAIAAKSSLSMTATATPLPPRDADLRHDAVGSGSGSTEVTLTFILVVSVSILVFFSQYMTYSIIGEFGIVTYLLYRLSVQVVADMGRFFGMMLMATALVTISGEGSSSSNSGGAWITPTVIYTAFAFIMVLWIRYASERYQQDYRKWRRRQVLANVSAGVSSHYDDEHEHELFRESEVELVFATDNSSNTDDQQQDEEEEYNEQ